jgi:hypothetical protein
MSVSQLKSLLKQGHLFRVRQGKKQACTWPTGGQIRRPWVGLDDMEGAYGSRPRPTCPCSRGRRRSASPGVCTRRCGRRTGWWGHRLRAPTWSLGPFGPFAHRARPPHLSGPRSRTGGRRPSARGCRRRRPRSGTRDAHRPGPHTRAHRCHRHSRRRRRTRTRRPGRTGCCTGTRAGRTLRRTESRSAGRTPFLPRPCPLVLLQGL